MDSNYLSLLANACSLQRTNLSRSFTASWFTDSQANTAGRTSVLAREKHPGSSRECHFQMTPSCHTASKASCAADNRKELTDDLRCLDTTARMASRTEELFCFFLLRSAQAFIAVVSRARARGTFMHDSIRSNLRRNDRESSFGLYKPSLRC